MQHEVDVVVKVHFPIDTDPERMRDKLYKAEKGGPCSRDFDLKVGQFPVRDSDLPRWRDRGPHPPCQDPWRPSAFGASLSRQSKRDEKDRKEVNPKAFTLHVNARITFSDVFAFHSLRRQFKADGLLRGRVKGQPMTDHVPIEETKNHVRL